MIQEIHISEIFNSFKDGSYMGFWRKGIFSYLIRYVQRFDRSSKDLEKVSHVGSILEVSYIRESEYDLLSFRLSHQTLTKGGQYDLWKIKFDKSLNRFILLNKTKYTDFYLTIRDYTLSKEQTIIGVKDSLSQYKQKYGLLTLILSLPGISHTLGKLSSFEKLSKAKRVCSKHSWIQSKFMGLISEADYLKNPNPTPEYVLTYKQGFLSGKLVKIKGLEFA